MIFLNNNNMLAKIIFCYCLVIVIKINSVYSADLKLVFSDRISAKYFRFEELTNFVKEHDGKYPLKCNFAIYNQINKEKKFIKGKTILSLSIKNNKELSFDTEIQLTDSQFSSIENSLTYLYLRKDANLDMDIGKKILCIHTIHKNEIVLQQESAGNKNTTKQDDDNFAGEIPGSDSLVTNIMSNQQFSLNNERVKSHNGIKLSQNANNFILQLDDSSIVKLVFIPPGTAKIGSPKKLVDSVVVLSKNPIYWNEYPVHSKDIIEPFWISETEISNRHFLKYQKTTLLDSTSFKSLKMDLPVVNISWFDAIDFCKWLTTQVEGFEFRLPHEIEWEYAARGSTNFQYPWQMDTISDSLANYSRVSDELRPVYSFPKGKSLQGLYNLAGNAYEWCLNSDYLYSADSTTSFETIFDTTAAKRALRGGSFMNSPYECRNSARFFLSPTSKNNHLGFRIVMLKSE